MSTFYVRPDGATYGAGNGTSYENAWAGFSSIIWGVAGVNAGDTLYICGRHYQQLTVDQTSVTVRGDYAGDAGVIDGNDVNDYCIYYQNKNGIIANIEVCNAVINNVLVQTDEANITSFVITNLYCHGAGRLNEIYPYDIPTGTGLLIQHINKNYTASGIIVSDCKFNNNGKHGIDLRGSNEATVINCLAEGNGFNNSGFGFHTHAPQLDSPINPNNWVNVSGDVYSNTVPGPYTIYRLRWSGSPFRLLLTNIGESSTPDLYEFGQIGSKIYVNIGENPVGQGFSTSVNTMGPIVFTNCVARYNIAFRGEHGVGLGADNFSENVTFDRCYAHDNEGDGLDTFATYDCYFTSCISVNNGKGQGGRRDGLVLLGSSHNTYVYNCLFSGNSGWGLYSALSTNLVAKNNIFYGSGKDGYKDYSTGVYSTNPIVENNIAYANIESGYDTTNPVSGTNLEVDPLLRGYNVAWNSPAVGAGVEIVPAITDFNGNAFTVPPNISPFAIESGRTAPNTGPTQDADYTGDWTSVDWLDVPTNSLQYPINDNSSTLKAYDGNGDRVAAYDAEIQNYDPDGWNGSSSKSLEEMNAQIAAAIAAHPEVPDVIVRVADWNNNVIVNQHTGTLLENSQFSLASTTKLFTGMVALHIIDLGYMDYTDTLESILPEFTGTNPAGATMAQLMSMTGGIGALAPQDNPTTGTLENWVQRIAADEFGNLNTPGTFEYSGTGLDVLYRCCEKVLWDNEGTMLEDLLVSLYQSLGMNNTATAISPPPESIPPEELALGHGRYLAGGGGLRSIGPDMIKFMRWLLTEQAILQPATHADRISFKVQNPTFENPPLNAYTSGEYGYCLYRDRVSAPTVNPPVTIGHGGSLGTVPWADLRTGVVGIIVGPNSLNTLFPLSLEIQNIIWDFYDDQV